MKYKVIAVNDNSPLRLREKASTSSEVLATIPVGTVVDFVGALEPVAGWVAVSYNGKIGYVSADYVALVTEDGTPTPAPDTNGKSSIDPPATGEQKSSSTILIIGAVAMVAGILANVFLSKKK